MLQCLGNQVTNFHARRVSGSLIGQLELQSDRMLIDSALRSQMEFQLGNAFADLSSGTITVTVNGQNFAVTTVVVPADLDGDAVPEPAAKQVTVSIDGRSLTAIVVDDEDKVGKI